MGRSLSPDALRELLGAYALDAVDDDERAQIDAWLDRVPNACRDADELRETASLLAQASADPPPELWARIEQQLGEPPPPLRLAPVSSIADAPTRAARPRRARSWLVAAAAALALVIAVSVGVLVAHQSSDQNARIDRMAAGLERDGVRQAALSAAMEPGARTAQLASADGTVVAKVVTTTDGRGYFMADDLPALPEGRTYQLWALMGRDPGMPVVSVGVMGRSPTMMAFTTDAAVRGFAVTVEDAPGAVAGTQPAMVTGWLA